MEWNEYCLSQYYSVEPETEEEEEPVKVERADAEELRQFIRDNLRVELVKDRDWVGDTRIKVKLYIGDDDTPFTKDEIYIRLSM